MKKICLLLVMILTAPLSSTTLKEFQLKFKNDLYVRQQGLMNKDTYYKFIDPFLNEAESKLVILKQIDTIEQSLVNSYALSLLQYNVLFFHNHVQSTPQKLIALNYNEKSLESILEKIKQQTPACKDLNVSTELANTLDLFKKANVDYCKKVL